MGPNIFFQQTSTADYDTNTLHAILSLVAGSIGSMRELLAVHSYLEVTTESIGLDFSSQDPLESSDLFPDSCDRLLYSLFSDSQLKLDLLTMRLQQNCYHLKRSKYRPGPGLVQSDLGSYLSQASTFEIEALYPNTRVESVFDKLVLLTEHMVRFIAAELPQRNSLDLRRLRIPASNIGRYKTQRFVKVTYDQALYACMENTTNGTTTSGDLFQAFGNLPVFVINPPREARQFIYKTEPVKEAVRAFDLYLPGTGLVVSGGILEENPQEVYENLSRQIPGVSLSTEGADILNQYSRHLRRSGNTMRGVVQFNIEGILNSILGKIHFLQTTAELSEGCEFQLWEKKKLKFPQIVI